MNIEDIVKPMKEIEWAICRDPSFVEGAWYGDPRPGHPEGQVIYHIEEVLANIDKFYKEDEDRDSLRLIALVHDTFKHKVNKSLPRTGENHHGMIARRFIEQYTDDEKVSTIVELHDEAYNAWCKGSRDGKWDKAKVRAIALVANLEAHKALDLYVKFYNCDNNTGDKSQDCYQWFCEIVGVVTK